jgi:hypothetical protein
MRVAARLSNAWPARSCRSAVSVLQAHVTKHPLRCSAMRAGWLKRPRLRRLLSLRAIPAVPPPCAAALPWRAVPSCGAPAAGCAQTSCSPDGQLRPSPSSPGRSSRAAPAAAAQACLPRPDAIPLPQSITLALTAAACRGVAGCSGPHRDTGLAVAAREHAGIVSPNGRTGRRRHNSTSGLLRGHACWTSILRRLCACDPPGVACAHVRMGHAFKGWLAAALRRRTPTWRRCAALVERSKRCFQRLQPDDDLHAGTGAPLVPPCGSGSARQASGHAPGHARPGRRPPVARRPARPSPGSLAAPVRRTRRPKRAPSAARAKCG